MATASLHSSEGSTISYYDRLPKGGNWLGELDTAAQNWRHQVTAFGGFDTGGFEISGSYSAIQDWVLNGLFRPIVVRDKYLATIWEGYVDTITINQAGLTVSHGPVTEIKNRVFGIYSGVDTSVYPPQIGVRKKTPVFNNSGSQADWGIWPYILSMAGVSNDNADQLVQMFLQEHGQPEKNSNFSFSGEEVSLTINCVGWYNTLRYPYNFTTNSGTVAISTRMTQILAAHPNSGWISSDYTKVTTNATAVPQYENDDQLAMEHLRGLTAMGDADLQRYIFGIYENRRAVYGPVSSQIDYTVELGDPKRQVFDSGNNLIPPWRIRPGSWIFFADFVPGLGSPFDDFQKDPRMLRVETIQYDMRTPFAVQVGGGISSKYEQRSARLGLRGTEV